MSNLDLRPFDKQPGEPDKRFAAFKIYRDLPSGERTIQKVAETIQKSSSLVRRWSLQENWLGRVAEYDVYLDRSVSQRKRLKDEKSKVDMTERHTKTSVYVQGKSIERLAEMTPEDWKKMSPARSIDMFLKLAMFERLSRGLPTNSIEVVTPEQLKQQAINEATIYLREMEHDFVNLTFRDRLEVVCQEFELTPEDLGYDADILNATTLTEEKEDSEE